MRLLRITGVLFAILLCTACALRNLKAIDNTFAMKAKLSDYSVYDGDPTNLSPAKDFEFYELTNELFSDYAEKQRLIKIPRGEKIKFTEDLLPEFPNGTILIKTFYYSKDQRITSKRILIETRVLVRHEGRWSAGTYLWNTDQSDALLTTSGAERQIEWINAGGKSKRLSFHVPSLQECSSCHNQNNVLTPIGPKVRNLNRNVLRNGNTINQLTYLQNIGLLSDYNHANTESMVAWSDTTSAIKERARAYLDVNCAHCHNSKGFCKENQLRFGYEIHADSTGLNKRKNLTIGLMRYGQMPLVGTKMIHSEGVELVKEYIRNMR